MGSILWIFFEMLFKCSNGDVSSQLHILARVQGRSLTWDINLGVIKL